MATWEDNEALGAMQHWNVGKMRYPLVGEIGHWDKVRCPSSVYGSLGCVGYDMSVGGYGALECKQVEMSVCGQGEMSAWRFKGHCNLNNVRW